MLKKYHLMNQDFNAKQVWISAAAKASGQAKEFKKIPIDVESVKVEGDIGEISTQNFRILKMEPFEFQPVLLQIHDLDFDQLFVFLNRPHPHPALGHLGVFNGEAYLRPQERAEIHGQISGLELIFFQSGNSPGTEPGLFIRQFRIQWYAVAGPCQRS
jgi:hypothetical protein